MDQPNHLSQISTLWPVVVQARVAEGVMARPAQVLLLERYGAAIRRYLLGALGDPDAADEVFQEFSLRLVRGDLRRVDPRCGRFRDFLKTILVRLVIDHRRKQGKRPLPLNLDLLVEIATEPADPDLDEESQQAVREELLRRTWQALQDWERGTGQPCFTVLRLRADHPQLSSADLAQHLGLQLGRPFTIDGLRQALHRARDRFADLLLEQVGQTLKDRSAESLEQELSDLGLLPYCRAALERCRRLAA